MMGDAPKEIWVMDDELGGPIKYPPMPDSRIPYVKYIRADIAEAWEEAAKLRRLLDDAAGGEGHSVIISGEAAYNRGLEEAAKIADKCQQQNSSISAKGFDEKYRRGIEAGAQAIAAAIRAQMKESDDV